MKKSLCLCLILVANFSNAQFIEREDRDKRYPIPASFVRGTPHQIGMFTHMAEITPSCKVAKSSTPVPLPRSPRDLTNTKYEMIFNYTLKEHLQKNYVMALTFVRDGKVIDQHYQYERRANDLFASFSAGKSITSILIGIALDEGLIASLDDPVSKYTDRINESSYSKIKIRSLLRMSSGIPYTEPDTVRGDAAVLEESLRNNSTSSVPKALNQWQRNSSNEGKKFN